MEALRTAFFRAGWLLPAWLPVAQVGGRALFNVVAGIYFFWGLIALMGGRVRVERSILVLYVLLIMAMALSATGAIDPERTLRKTAEFLAHSMVFFFTLMVLQSGTERTHDLAKALALSGCVLLVLLFVEFAWLRVDNAFNPRVQMSEDNLPFLITPLLYISFTHIRITIARYTVVIGIIVLTSTYIGVSGGRAAFLGLLVALTLFFVLVLQRRWYEILVSGVLVSMLVMMAGGKSFDRDIVVLDSSNDAGWMEKIDRLSGDRISLWRHALENRPENVLLGVGVGNVAYVPEAVETRHGKQVKHLHNFVLDAWYEIGVVGATLLVVLLLLLLRAGYLACKRQTLAERRLAGVFLSSSAAILCAALFSFSYGSRQFSLYLFVMFAGAYALYRQASAAYG